MAAVRCHRGPGSCVSVCLPTLGLWCLLSCVLLQSPQLHLCTAVGIISSFTEWHLSKEGPPPPHRPDMDRIVTPPAEEFGWPGSCGQTHCFPQPALHSQGKREVGCRVGTSVSAVASRCVKPPMGCGHSLSRLS